MTESTKSKVDPVVTALEAVYAALRPLDTEARRRVLASTYALLEIPATAGGTFEGFTHARRTEPVPKAPAARAVSLIELMQDKRPRSNAERITLFAYYRDKYEGISRFARADLEPYFAKAKEQPARNYDRDFVGPVRKGWLHEDEADSYITSKGIEAVEAGFTTEPKARRRAKTAKKKRKKRPKRSTRTKAK